MKDRFKIVAYKIIIWIMGILLLLQVGRLAMSLKREEGMEAVQEKNSVVTLTPVSPMISSQPTASPTSVPFVLTNFDKIRVVITNKESGSIYHDEVEAWQKNTTYRGTLEFLETEEGYVVVNELPIEEYLYSVVPSEMPANYPMEALKAQAICARTYAYLHIMSPAYPQWNAHVDDTTSFQVYHSVEEQERTTQAVNETEGVVLLSPDGQSLAETYYYSTSWGYGSDAHVWRTKYSDNYPYIKSKHIHRTEAVETMTTIEERENYTILQNGWNTKESFAEELFKESIEKVDSTDYEAQENWYRWKYTVERVDLERMRKVLQKRYEANNGLVLTLKGSHYVSKPIEELDVLVDLVIDKREAGGVADELFIITEKNVYKVITELNIRYILNDGVTKVIRQDGTAVAMESLLPSAFIVLENQYDNGEIIGYHISGGGFGHGAGMSQNAAKHMAEEGLDAGEILTFFFEDCTLEKGR